jgi:hypothetical protein
VTIVATYDDTEQLGRVQLALSGYNVLADYAIVERSTDQITWETIRGGELVPVTAGAGHIDDYEFQASVTNYYRVTAYNAAGGHLVGVGAASHADNASVAPAVPAGYVAGDTLVIVAANSDTAVTINTPAGWTLRRSIGNYAMFYKIATGSESAPTVTFTGSGAGDSCSAQMACLRFVDFVNRIGSSTHQAGTSQNISVPGTVLTTSAFPRFVLMHGWKQDDWTSVADIVGFTEIGDPSTTLGSDQGLVWSFTNTTGSIATQTWVVTGGTSALNYGGMQIFPTVPTNQETQSITPVVSRWRLKNPSRPSLNQIIEPLPVGTITRPGRTGTFDVLGRTLPVAVLDISGSRRFQLKMDVFGYSQKEDMDRRLATGSPMFLQGPSITDQLPTLYFVAASVDYSQDTTASGSYTFTIDVIECAKPGPTVFAATTTWADIVTEFATWADLVAAEATWSDVVDRISVPDVIVP